MTAETTFSRPDLPKAWPFEEAAKVAARLRASGKGEALFETGYGPSGLPHIGTFGEVARTTWVRRAFEPLMPGRPTRPIAFRGQLGGLPKAPAHPANQDLLARQLA